MADKATAKKDYLNTEERGVYTDESGYPANVCVLKILEDNGMTQTDLAKRLGMRILSLVQRLHRKNTTVDKVVEMLDALGYELVAVSKDRTVKSKYYRIRSV